MIHHLYQFLLDLYLDSHLKFKNYYYFDFNFYLIIHFMKIKEYVILIQKFLNFSLNLFLIITMYYYKNFYYYNYYYYYHYNNNYYYYSHFFFKYYYFYIHH